MQGKIYQDEDGDTYSITLLPGMSPEEITAVAANMPKGLLPEEIIELLSYASGLEYGWLDEIRFTDKLRGWNDRFFAHPITLCGDGRGNSWIVDVDSEGNWGPVYFMDHDPPVLMKFADDLAGFLLLLDEDGKNRNKSFFQKLYGPIEGEIYNCGRHPVADYHHAYDLSSVSNLPEAYRVESLENQPPGAGFMWAPNRHEDFVARLGDRPVWIIEVKKRPDLLKRLFSLFQSL